MTTAVPGASNTGRGSRTAKANRLLMLSLPDRVEHLEELAGRILSETERLVSESERLAGLIENWTNRQPIIIQATPTHRRQADGGAGGRREMRGG